MKKSIFFTKGNILLTSSIITVIIVIFISYLLNNPRLKLPFLSSKLTEDILNKSLEKGTKFIINNQKEKGNFNYEYNWITKNFSDQENEVRQAGTLWSLALIYNNKKNKDVEAAIKKGFNFFTENSKLIDKNKRIITYPGSTKGKTGTIALVSLAYIDYLRSSPDLTEKEKYLYALQLYEYINFLIYLKNNNGLWYSAYDIKSGIPLDQHSPYADGESLLALIKTCKYLNNKDLLPIIKSSADACYKYNVLEALKKNPDSNITKGFYQWGSMSFFEIADSNWEDTDKYGKYVTDLADWMIDVHKTLNRSRNTAYAYEGIIHAYALAKRNNNKNQLKKYEHVINEGLYKLTSWQVGGPIENSFIKLHKSDQYDKYASGGVQNHSSEPQLRIDVTQHQMHAVILALKYLY